MKRFCRTCKKPLPKTKYFYHTGCITTADIADDDSIYVPSSFDLDPFTESIVEIFDDNFYKESNNDDI